MLKKVTQIFTDGDFDFQSYARKKVRDLIGLNEYEIGAQKQIIAQRINKKMSWHDFAPYLDQAQLELVLAEPELAQIDPAIVRTLSLSARESLASDPNLDSRILEALSTDRSAPSVWYELLSNPSLTQKCLQEAWAGAEFVSGWDHATCARCYLMILQMPKANECLYQSAVLSFFGNKTNKPAAYLPHQKQHLITRAQTFCQLMQMADKQVQLKLLKALIDHGSIPTASWQTIKSSPVLKTILQNHPQIRNDMQSWERMQRRHGAEAAALAEFSSR